MLCGSKLLLHACIQGPALDFQPRLRICDRQWGFQRMRMNTRSPRSRTCASLSIQEIAQIAEAAVLDSPIDQQITPAKTLQAAVVLAVTAFSFYSCYKEKIKALNEPKKKMEQQDFDSYLKNYKKRAESGRWDDVEEPTPAGDSITALLAGVISWVVYESALKVDSLFADGTLPNSEWQIGNGSITSRAILVGSMWLVSAFYCGNCVGMLAAVVERLRSEVRGI